MAEKGFTWSEVVYPGTEVYSRLVMFEVSGVSGSSVYVVYSTRSVHDGVLRELSRFGSTPHRNVMNLPLPVFVDFANPILVCALQWRNTGESSADRSREDQTRKTCLELPEFTLSQPYKHGALLPFHPQLVILFQLFSLGLAI